MAKHRWNISKERGERLIYNSIVYVLSKQHNHSLEIKKLKVKISENLKYIKITYNNKPKDLFNYIKNNLGGLIYIIDSYNDLSITNKAGECIISYLDPILNEWIII